MATKGDSEEARGHAILEAKGRILGFLCTDNDFRDKNFLRVMTWYASLTNVCGAYTAQYDHVWYDKALSRYFALLGANDPICWWLKKADRGSYRKSYRTQCIDFNTNRISRFPSIGDNGFFIKKCVLDKAPISPKTHFVIDITKDLQKIGYATYYIVATQKLWHRTGESWWVYLKKRWQYADNLYFKRLKDRRWVMVETKRDWAMVVLFTICSITIIPHLIYATLGYRRKQDWAWFIHPWACLLMTALYGLLLMKHLLRQLLSRLSIGKRALQGA